MVIKILYRTHPKYGLHRCFGLKTNSKLSTRQLKPTEQPRRTKNKASDADVSKRRQKIFIHLERIPPPRGFHRCINILLFPHPSEPPRTPSKAPDRNSRTTTSFVSIIHQSKPLKTKSFTHQTTHSRFYK